MSGAATHQTPQRAPAPALPAVSVKHRPAVRNRRLTLLAGVSALALAGILLPQPPAALAVPVCTGSAQTVTSPGYSEQLLTNGGEIAITASGSATAGISAATCDATAIANAGSLSGAPTAVTVESSRTVGTLTNTGTISGIGNAIANSGSIGSLTNNASISAGYFGISNFGAIGGLNNNASINGGPVGISNTGTFGTLNNAAAIFGNCNCSTRLNDRIPAQNLVNRLIRIESASCCRANNRSNAGEQVGTPL